MNKIFSLTLGAVSAMLVNTVYADTYYVNFINYNINENMAVTLYPPISGSKVTCSGECSTLKPGGELSLTITSTEDSLPYGAASTGFQYPITWSLCPGGKAIANIVYTANYNYQVGPETATIKISDGQPLPAGIYEETQIQCPLAASPNRH